MFSLLPFYCFSGSAARKMASRTLIKEGSVCTPAVPHVTSLSVGKAKDAPASLAQSMLTQLLTARCRGWCKPAPFGALAARQMLGAPSCPAVLPSSRTWQRQCWGCRSAWREGELHSKHFLCLQQYALPINRLCCREGQFEAGDGRLGFH